MSGEAAPRAAAPFLAVGRVLGRSFFAFATLGIVLGTTLWGPWISLAAALLLYTAAKRLA